jgi:hypothetical protein
MADTYAYHLIHPNQKYIDTVQDNQQLFLFCFVHAVNREQELAGPMVISYLMLSYLFPCLLVLFLILLNNILSQPKAPLQCSVTPLVTI